MELVPGPTLADSITGPMPPDRAINIARQVAYALEAAHDQGIVHRDLKPANIKVRADGTVKVLDFGLAKSMLDDPDRDRLATQSPTILSPALTQAGVILGTAAYMSPEQATARFVDKRSDIWAFGCVLYEMLTGRRAFDAPTVTETLAAILERDVDWTKLPATTPVRAITVLRRALERDPKNRLHDIADARIELEDPRPHAPRAADGRSARNTASRYALIAVIASLVTAAAVWFLKPTGSGQPAANEVTRLVVTPEFPLSPDSQGVLALSPDGQSTPVSDVAFSMPRLSPDLTRVSVMRGGGNGTQGGAGDLWAYDLGRNTRTRLTFDGTSNFPLWSPDGTRFAYSSGQSGRYEIRVRTIGGQSEETLPSNEGTNYPLSWSPDGRHIAAVSVNAGSSNDLWVYTLDHPPTARLFLQTKFREGAPTFAPDGNWIAYASDQSGRNEIYMRPFPNAGEEWTISTEGGTEPRWASRSDQLFYRQGDAVIAVTIKTAPRVEIGTPRRLFQRRYNPSVGFWPNYDVTPDGQRLLMIKGTGLEAPTQIRVVLNWFSELNRLVPVL